MSLTQRVSVGLRFVWIGALCVGLSWPASAWPCGGSERYVLDAPMQPERVHLSQVLYGTDPYWGEAAPLTSFLYPFVATDPERYADLEASLFLYEGETPAPELAREARAQIAAYERAVASGDLGQMREAAAAAVEQILDLPAPLAASFAPSLRGPVELLELGDALSVVPISELRSYFSGGTPAHPLLQSASQVRGLEPAAADALLASSPRHPRSASLRWLSLRHAAARDIPDGWSVEDIQARIVPAAFTALMASAEGWLRDYPNHPLSDYVRLKKLRLHYLHGDVDAAWALLFDLYARHPVRAAHEMRFLSRQEMFPQQVDFQKLPPEVAAAMLPESAITPASWSALWKRTTSLDPSLALPLQERLLLSLASAEQPPDLGQISAFPQGAAAPSETWAKLRLLVLIGAKRADDARAQAALLPAADPWTAALRARLDLARGDFASAVSQPGLEPAVWQYLVRVLAPEKSLEIIADSDDPALRWEARLTLALRSLQARGSYQTGIRWLKPVDPERAALWTEASALSRRRDLTSTLAYARFLREKAGLIFINNNPEEIVWYRSLPQGDDAHQKQITSWLTRSFATYHALVAYAAWLDGLDVASLDGPALFEVRSVLTEVDEAYNLLLNYGSSDSYAWGAVLPSSPPAVTIRRVGKVIRARAQ